MRRMIVAGKDERPEPIERLRPHTLLRHLETRRPDNRVEDQFAEIGVPPVGEEMAAGESEAASAVGALDGPADGEIIRFPGRPGDDDGSEARIIFAETNPIIVFLLGGERVHAAGDGMPGGSQFRLRRPGLNRGIPAVGSVAGFVIEVAARPVNDLIANADGIERAPVKENQAAAAVHLTLDDLQVVVAVERMIPFLAIGSVRSQENRVGIVER